MQTKAIKGGQIKIQRPLNIGGRNTVGTADLLFDWFGFDQTSKTVVHSTQVAKWKQNKQEVRRTMIHLPMVSVLCPIHWTQICR